MLNAVFFDFRLKVMNKWCVKSITIFCTVECYVAVKKNVAVLYCYATIFKKHSFAEKNKSRTGHIECQHRCSKRRNYLRCNTHINKHIPYSHSRIACKSLKETEDTVHRSSLPGGSWIAMRKEWGGDLLFTVYLWYRLKFLPFAMYYLIKLFEQKQY